jgi:hypothetical protein
MLFGGSSSPDPKSVGKEARKEIKSGQHDIDRQVRDLERQEQKSIQDAKKLAKAGDMKVWEKRGTLFRRFLLFQRVQSLLPAT